MQEDRVRVSVIVPNYNHEPFLEERLESIFSQTWPDFEVILLDDASTDGSPEILRQHSGHPKVSAVELNRSNSGSPFRQWQRGIEMARGEVIWIAESDDSAEPAFLEKLMERMDAGADLACCRPQKIDGEGRVFSDKIWADSLDADRWKNDFANEGKAEIRDYLCYRNTLSSASACIFRKRPGLFPETVLQSRFSGDWLFWIHYLRQGRIAYTGETLSLHRSHEKTTRNQHDNENELARLQERLRAIRLARKVGGRGRIRPSEIWKYRYLIRVIQRLRSEPDPVRVLGRIPAELLLYTWISDWRER